MSTATALEIEVSESSLQAFVDRGRSEAFNLEARTKKGTPAAIFATVNGRPTPTKKGYLHRACGKKNGNRFVLKKKR